MTFTIEQTETAIRYAVALRGPDFVNREFDSYDTCQYLWTDENGVMRPSCIVGVVASFLGVPHEELEASEGTTIVAATFAHMFDPDARWALHVAQTIQDRQEPWGAALTAFNSCRTIV